MSDRLAVMHAGRSSRSVLRATCTREPEDALRRRLPGRLEPDGRHGAGLARRALPSRRRGVRARGRRRPERRDGAGEDRDPTRAGRARTPRAPTPARTGSRDGRACGLRGLGRTGHRPGCNRREAPGARPEHRQRCRTSRDARAAPPPADALRVLPAGDRASTEEAGGRTVSADSVRRREPAERSLQQLAREPRATSRPTRSISGAGPMVIRTQPSRPNSLPARMSKPRRRDPRSRARSSTPTSASRKLASEGNGVAPASCRPPRDGRGPPRSRAAASSTDRVG